MITFSVSSTLEFIFISRRSSAWNGIHFHLDNIFTRAFPARRRNEFKFSKCEFNFSSDLKAMMPKSRLNKENSRNEFQIHQRHEMSKVFLVLKLLFAIILTQRVFRLKLKLKFSFSLKFFRGIKTEKNQ